jgi:hypothetical protein
MVYMLFEIKYHPADISLVPDGHTRQYRMLAQSSIYMYICSLHKRVADIARYIHHERFLSAPLHSARLLLHASTLVENQLHLRAALRA